MKSEKKLESSRHKIHRDKKRRKRIGAVASLIGIIFFSILLINSILNKPSISQPVVSDSMPKAAIVDQLSLTYPNQTFIQTATAILEQAGYAVDYYPGENVTVDFYRDLATRGCKLIVLRVHSALGGAGLPPLALFTSELYDKTKYFYEQLAAQLQIVLFNEGLETGTQYFGIMPSFITSSMNGRFDNATIIMMGCDSLAYDDTADAFIQKGAGAVIGWTSSVSASHTDQATTCLLQHLIAENQTIKQATENTEREVGPDPTYFSQLTYYSPRAEE